MKIKSIISPENEKQLPLGLQLNATKEQRRLENYDRY